MSEFKALILSGTLKPKGQFSHTETLAGVLVEELKEYDIESEIVRLNEYEIPPGVESKGARLLKENPMPQDTAAIKSYIADGTVGMRGAKKTSNRDIQRVERQRPRATPMRQLGSLQLSFVQT